MKPRITVLIVDDEPIARSGLRAILSEDPDVEVVGEAGNGREALAMIERLDPDIVTLDVQMPEMDGFAVLRSMDPADWPLILFITAYDAYAVDAFELNAVDYLLKPFGDARARAAIDRAKERIRQSELADVGARIADIVGRESRVAAPTEYLKQIAHRDGERIVFIDTASVDWLEAADDYVRVHAATHGSILLRARLRDLHEQLDPSVFIRIHRSTVVNLDRIGELRPLYHGDYEAVLKDGTRLKVSRSYARTLAERTGNYF
jgi:two-component system, LytTR family, response regulator